MSLGNSGRRPRCLLVWSLACAGLALAALVTGERTLTVLAGLTDGRLAREPLDVAVTDLAAAVLLGCATWLWLVTTWVVVEAARGVVEYQGPRRGVPAGLRRALLAACGVALVGGLAQPSYALSTRGHATHAGPSPTRRGLTGLPLPDRAVAPRSGPAERAPRPTETVVVTPGDTLWAIAARTVPHRSPDARIAARWQAIYAANRSVIGSDPDVILPGQRLVLPGKESS